MTLLSKAVSKGALCGRWAAAEHMYNGVVTQYRYVCQCCKHTGCPHLMHAHWHV